jgi:hypothetical protein
VAEIVTVEGDVELSVLKAFSALDPLQLVAQTPGQQDPAWLHANEGKAHQVTMVFDQLVAKALNGKSEGLAAE